MNVVFDDERVVSDAGVAVVAMVAGCRGAGGRFGAAAPRHPTNALLERFIAAQLETIHACP